MKKLLAVISLVLVASCGHKHNPKDYKMNSLASCPAPANDGSELVLQVECTGKQSVTGLVFDYSVLRFESGDEHVHGLIANNANNIVVSVGEPGYDRAQVGVDYSYPVVGHSDFSLDMHGCSPELNVVSNVSDDTVTSCDLVYPRK